jgi:hypothetical protein
MAVSETEITAMTTEYRNIFLGQLSFNTGNPPGSLPIYGFPVYILSATSFSKQPQPL